LGGSVRSLLNMLQAVKGYGIIPMVVIPQSGVVEKELNCLDVKNFVIPYIAGYGRVGTASKEKADTALRNNYKTAFTIREIIKNEQIDLVHINESPCHIGALAALMADVPYVWHIREFMEEDFGFEFWDKELKIELFQNSDQMISISKCISKKYKEDYGIDSIQIYNGLDTKAYKGKGEEVNFELHNFIITGTITPAKGQLDAVKAVELLVQEGYEDVHLMLVGGGQYFPWFIKRYIQKHSLENNVEVISFQNDLKELRKKCPYALTTSRMEALGRCTIEAMLAGSIVIGADTGGTKEIIGSDETRGFLYKQGDYTDLASVMKRLMSESTEIKTKCCKRAQEYAEDVFSLEKYGSKMVALYEKVIDSYKLKDRTKRKELLKRITKRYEIVNADLKGYVIDNRDNQACIEKWSDLQKKNINLGNVLKELGYHTVAIYGMGKIGCRLYDELESAEISIPYVIDQVSGHWKELFEVRTPNDVPTGVDLILVSVYTEEGSIVEYYKNNFDCSVIGIGQLLQMALETTK